MAVVTVIFSLGLSYSNYDDNNNDLYRFWRSIPLDLARVLDGPELDSFF
jgi:hypothetical protein